MVILSNIKESITKLCTFTFNFSDVNTLFADKDAHIWLEYGYSAIPQPLEPYLGSINNLPYLEQSDQNVSIHSTSYHLNYITAKVYDEQTYIGIIIVGPFLYDEPTSLMVENVLFENKLSISLKYLIKQYYSSLPLINPYKTKLMADFLACSLTNSGFLAQDLPIGSINHNFKTKLCYAPNTLKQTDPLAADVIERRYQIENKLMHAIEHGDKERAEELSINFIGLGKNISDRIPQDALRSKKNISFVLNTLLRKAAEQGGLHSTKIHSISEKIAIQIEKAGSIQELISLQKSMVTTYFNATHKYSLKGYPYIIRKAIEYIRMHLDEDLSLGSISNALNISSPELSRQFKKETGDPITHYINNLRINEAVYFLENKAMSITDIAHMVGFNDVNYFTRVFKGYKGVTPSGYRNRVK